MWFMVGLDLKDATDAINGLKTNAILIRTKTNNKLFKTTALKASPQALCDYQSPPEAQS